MFERLFKKKNTLSYIPCFLVTFSTMLMGINPFSGALFVTLVYEKVPVLIPFLFTCIVQLLLFGVSATIRYLSFILVFSIVTAFSKKAENHNKDTFTFIKEKVPRILISGVISEAILFILKVENVSNLLEIICFILFTTLFSIIYSFGFKYFYHLIDDKESEVGFKEAICFSVLLVTSLGLFKMIPNIGTMIWIALCMVFLMLVVWKKNLLFAIIISLVVSITIILCDISLSSISIFILTAIIGIATMLLSKAGKRGALIGLVFSSILLMITMFNVNGNNIQDNSRFNEDYLAFLKSSLPYLSGDDYNKFEEEIARVEEYQGLKQNAKNTTSGIILRSMLIGFFIICIIPDKILNIIEGKVPKAPNVETLMNRIFNYNKIYLLNPGKESDKDKIEKDCPKE